MALARQWLIGVTSAALLAAIADGLMPKGPVKQIGTLICALLLLCVLLRPVLTSEFGGAIQIFSSMEEQAAQQREQLSEQSDTLLKQSIEHRCSAYIVDKAAQLGAVCQVQTECVPGEGGMWLPAIVRVTGQMEPETRKALSQVIEKELGIDMEHQLYSGGG